MTDEWGDSVGGGLDDWEPDGDPSLYTYVHVNNIFINPNESDARYFCEGASSSNARVNDTVISPVQGETYYRIDNWSIYEETDTYISIMTFFADAGTVSSVSNIDNFTGNMFDELIFYTRAIPSLPNTPDTPDTPSDNPSTPDIPDEPIDGLSISEIDINGITYSIKDKSIYTKKEVNTILNTVREKLGLEPFDYSSIDNDNGSGSGSGETTKYTLSLSGWSTFYSADISITVNGSTTSYNTTTTESISQEVDKDSSVDILIKDNTYHGTYINQINGSYVTQTRNTSFIMDKDYTIELYTTDGIE